MRWYSQTQPQHPDATAAGQGVVPPQVAAPAATPQRLGLRRGCVAPTAGALAVVGELGPSEPMPAVNGRRKFSSIHLPNKTVGSRPVHQTHNNAHVD